MSNTEDSFLRLYKITKKLCAEDGCPWDREQTPLSLRHSLIEESFEACDAITEQNFAHIKEELGDVLFNVLLIAQICEKTGAFFTKDVFDEISDKLIRRHPHVFKESDGASEMKTEVKNSEAVLNQWDRIKENVEGRREASVLDSVPESFPPLLKAYKFVSKAAKTGFTWKTKEDARKKVFEELSEIDEALKKIEDIKKSEADVPFTISGSNKELDKAQLNLEEEFGDAFLALVNYARMAKVEPEVALERANQKFKKRFQYVEEKLKEAADTAADKAEGGLVNTVRADNDATTKNEALLLKMISLWNEAKDAVHC